MLNREQIINYTDPITFEKGETLRHEEDWLEEFFVERDAESPRHEVVHALIRSGNSENGSSQSHHTLYEVACRVDLLTDKVDNFYCECPAYEDFSGLCEHCVATLLEYIVYKSSAGAAYYAGRKKSGQRTKTTTAANELAAKAAPANYRKKVMTSEIITGLLKRKGERKSAPVLQREVFGKIHIEPSFTMRNSQLFVEFKIGMERMYVLKNVFEFAEHMTCGETFSYGKKLEFFHTQEAFDPDSAELAKFIVKWALSEIHAKERRSIYEHRSHYVNPDKLTFTTMPPVREIGLEGAALDDFFDAYCARSNEPIIVTTGNPRFEEAREEVFTLVDQVPPRKLYINGSDDRLTLTCDQERVLYGSRFYYTFMEGILYRAPMTGVKPIDELFDHFNSVIYDRELVVGADDIPRFTKEILPHLKEQFICEIENFNEADFAIKEADFEFYLDAPTRDRILMKCMAVYDGRKYNLFEQNADAGVRDIVSELEARQLACTCFSGEISISEEMLNEGMRTGSVSISDEQQIYELVTVGVEGLQALGTVFVSDSLKKIEVKSAPKVSIGLSIAGDLLELTMNSPDISRAELVGILTKYDRHKKYFRLKNGDFIDVDEDSIQVLAELKESLNLSAAQLEAEAIEIPKFRALYLDQQLKEKQSLSVDRNRSFRGLIRNMKTVEDNDFEVPASLKDVLREYQKTGFLWLKTLAANGFGGILADDMGLGKTLQVIAFLLSEQEAAEAAEMAEASETAEAAFVENLNCANATAADFDITAVNAVPGAVTAKSAQNAPACDGAGAGVSKPAEFCRKPSLIVCPASLVYNWEHEIHTFAPQLKTRLIVGTAEERKLLIDDLKNGADTELSGKREYDGKKEAGRISSRGEICITSYELLRRDQEEYEKIEFACQILDEAQYIKNHTTKAAHSVKAVKAGFKLALTGTPVENRLSELWSIFDYLMPGFLYSYEKFRKELEQPIVQMQDEPSMERLRKMVQPFILRRLKRDVLRDLPEKIEKNMFTSLEGEQLKLYDAHVAQLQNMLRNQSDDEFRSSKIQVLSALTKLRQICCDPSLVFEDYQGGSNKVELCMELIQNGVDSGHQILLFSQFTTMLSGLEQRLDEAGIPYYLLTGATPKATRMELVSKFNEGAVPVFLISLKAGGTGLNLTAADMVIHFDPWWNLAVQNQATDRAHRMGQKKVVSVYKLIAQNTIEENIIKLQARKKALADQLLSGADMSSATFSREELLELLG